MSKITSSGEDLTINADSTNSIKFTTNNVERASISSAGAFTSTSIDATKLSGTIPNFTSTGIDDNATSNAIVISAEENVGIGVTPESGWPSNKSVVQIGQSFSISSRNDAVYTNISNNSYDDGGTWKYNNTDEAQNLQLDNDGGFIFKVAPSGSADAAISWTTAMVIENNGYIKAIGVYNQSASDSANVVIDGAGNLYRATSSIKYKKNIETMEDEYADAILSLRPVWYRSKQELDNPEWGYWGFIAEEVADIDPRLVAYRKTRVDYDADGNQVDITLDVPEAEGVQYDRIVPHLVNLLKRQATTIANLTARIEALEA